MSDCGTLALVMKHPALCGARERLARYRERAETEPLPESHWKELEEVKRAAVQEGDQQLATAVWCLETISTIQERYLTAFSLMKQGAYFDAWCALERCEVHLHHLGRHFPVDDDGVRQFVEDPANPPAFNPREAAERVPLEQWQVVVRQDSHGKELIHHVVELELGNADGPRRNWRLIAATTSPRVMKKDDTSLSAHDRTPPGGQSPRGLRDVLP